MRPFGEYIGVSVHVLSRGGEESWMIQNPEKKFGSRTKTNHFLFVRFATHPTLH